jgi:peptidoglycan/LPS O-acetylase OafA/YrhL
LKTASGIIWIIICIALLELNRQTAATQKEFLFFETIINNFVLPWGGALLLYGLITEQNFVVRLLSFPLITLLGKASYSFYLVHNGFLFRPLYFGLGQKIWLVYIALQIISGALYKGIERPLHRLIRGKFLIDSPSLTGTGFHKTDEDAQVAGPGQQHR